MTMTEKEAFISNKLQLQNHSLTFFHKNKSLISATSFLSRSLVHSWLTNTTASMDKYVPTMRTLANARTDLDIFWSKNFSKYLEVKLKVLKKGDKNVFRRVQNFTMGEPDFNQFRQLRKQVVIAAKNVCREEQLSPVPLPTVSKVMDEELKLAHKGIDVVDRANRKVCVFLLLYSVDKPESSIVHYRFFAKKMKEEKFQLIVYVNFKLEEFIYLLDVMNSVYNNCFTNQSIRIVL